MLRVLIITIFVNALLLVGCQEQKTDQSSSPEGIVVANQAYKDNFGNPPRERKGEPTHASAICR